MMIFWMVSIQTINYIHQLEVRKIKELKEAVLDGTIDVVTLSSSTVKSRIKTSRF